MKKIKIIFINIILIVIILYGAKWVTLYYFLREDCKEYSISCVERVNYEMIHNDSFRDVYKRNYYRSVENKDSDKPPIVLLGCSYTQGFGSLPDLKEDEIFSALLGRILKEKRPIYNRGMVSQGLQGAIWQFKEGDLFDVVNHEPEYIIYTLINDQIRRLYMECCLWNRSAFYRKKGNGIELIENTLFYSYPMRLYRYLTYERIHKISKEEKFEFLKRHFIYLKNLSDTKWKKAKWIILYYNDDGQDFDIERLENNGFKVIRLSDIVPENFFEDEKYRSTKTNRHPSKYAWEIITPALYSKLHEIYGLN